MINIALQLSALVILFLYIQILRFVIDKASNADINTKQVSAAQFVGLYLPVLVIDQAPVSTLRSDFHPTHINARTEPSWVWLGIGAGGWTHLV
jgi:hypothetical protein